MLDYTDIPSKIEDVQNALDSLYNLIYGQYDGIFQGCVGLDKESKRNANRLSDAFEDILRDAYMDLKEKIIWQKGM